MEIILRQIGVPFVELSIEKVSPDKYPLVILNSAAKDFGFDVQKYLSEGGTILCEADVYYSVFKKKIRLKYLKYIYPSPDDNIFNNLPECDIYKSSYVVDESNHLVNQNDFNAVYSATIGQGKIIVFPSGFSSLINDSRIKRKNFQAFGAKETNERISVVSKGTVKLYIERAIEELYHHRNLPFVSKWHFPNGEKNIFCFRVDTDFGKIENVAALYEVFKKNDVSATWFVETGSVKDATELYSNFVKQEIALHCYEHKTFNPYDSLLADTKKGLTVLEKTKQKISGYAAPYGEWNTLIGEMVKKLSFSYSSEFSYAYDALPFFPYYNNSFSNVLQIPVHPISSGRLYWGGNTDEDICNYYLTIIDENLKLFEPIILYTHPEEKRFEMLDKIFQKINSYGIKNLKFIEYAEWWKKREELDFIVEYENNNIKISSNNTDSSIWFRISLPGGKIFLSHSGNLNDANNVEIQTQSYDLVVSKLKSLKKTSLRMIWHDLLSKYRKLKS